jgi:hypothetical protein
MFIIFAGLLFIVFASLLVWFYGLAFIPRSVDKEKRRRVIFEDLSPRQKIYILRRLKEKQGKETK